MRGRPKGLYCLSDFQQLRLLEAYREGVPIDDLCARFKISTATLYFFRRLHNVPCRYPLKHKKERRNANEPAAHVHGDGAHREQACDVLPS